MLPNAKTCMGLQHGFYQLERLGVLAQGQQDLQYKVKCFNNIQKANTCRYSNGSDLSKDSF